MANMDKKSGLLQIIKHGNKNQRGDAFNYLKPIIIAEGDFQTASRLIGTYADIFETRAKSNEFMKETSDSFFNKLDYNRAKDGTESLIDYMNNSLTPEKSEAEDTFPLFAIIGLYQAMDSGFSVHTSGKLGNMPGHIPEFKSVKHMYHAMEALQTMKLNSSQAWNAMPAELRSAIKVSNYLHGLLDNNRDDSNKSDCNDVNIIRESKIEFPKAKNYFSSARGGYISHLEVSLNDAKKGSTEARFIKALLSCAAMVRVIDSFDGNHLYGYNRHSEFEKQSDVFAAVETYAPIFALERIRSQLVKKEELSINNSEALFELDKNASTLVKPFSSMIRNLYMGGLALKYAKE